MNKRLEQISSVIMQAVSEIIRDEVSDPGIYSVVSITGVKISGDLKNAIIYYSVLGEQEDWDSTEEALSRARGYIQKLLGQRLVLKETPKLKFVPDHTIEQAQKIERIIQENITDDL